MHTYRNTFPYQNTFIAVVHAENEQQALRNIRVAQDNHADGVFLINHSISPEELVEVYKKAKKEFTGFWLGMNILGLSVLKSINWTPDEDVGLWFDDIGIREDTPDHLYSLKATRSWAERSANGNRAWKGVSFGGVAFKYQAAITDVARAAGLGSRLVDVVTTSGEGTGFAPDPEKIRLMKQAIGVRPLAVASGITPENVHLYVQWADCFLVATGVSDSHTELNPQRVRQLAMMMRISRS
jgi:hypothetical protein